MFEVAGIDHIVLRTTKLQAMLDFYAGILGCKVERETSPKTGLTQLRSEGLSSNNIYGFTQSLRNPAGLKYQPVASIINVSRNNASVLFVGMPTGSVSWKSSPLLMIQTALSPEPRVS